MHKRKQWKLELHDWRCWKHGCCSAVLYAEPMRQRGDGACQADPDPRGWFRVLAARGGPRERQGGSRVRWIHSSDVKPTPLLLPWTVQRRPPSHTRFGDLGYLPTRSVCLVLRTAGTKRQVTDGVDGSLRQWIEGLLRVSVLGGWSRQQPVLERVLPLQIATWHGQCCAAARAEEETWLRQRPACAPGWPDSASPMCREGGFAAQGA